MMLLVGDREIMVNDILDHTRDLGALKVKLYTIEGLCFVGKLGIRWNCFEIDMGDFTKTINANEVAAIEIVKDYVIIEEAVSVDWSQCPEGFTSWKNTPNGAFWYGYNEYGMFHEVAPDFGSNPSNKIQYKPRT